MNDAKSSWFHSLSRRSSWPLFTLVITVVVAWLVFSNEVERKRQLTEQRTERSKSQVVQVPKKVLQPQKYTAAFVSSVVPLPATEKRIYLYASPTTNRYFSAKGMSYDNHLRAWHAFFKDRNLSVATISELNTVPRKSGSVVIVPSALALSNIEKQELVVLQRQGVGILATGAMGSYDAKHAWHGYGFMERLFGIRVASKINLSGSDHFLNLSGNTAITTGYPAGRRIWLEGPPDKWLHIGGANHAGFYSNWMRQPIDAGPLSGISYGELTASSQYARWVLLGFPETAWGAEAKELFGLLENSLHWLARGTAVSKEAWPLPYRAAYVIEMDTEEGFGTARALGEMMDAIDASATFYCVTSEALRHPDLVRALAKGHEIAFHGDVHNSFQWQAETVQSDRLDRMRDEMTKILGQPIPLPGFRPPREEYDQLTERLLAAKGFGHHAVDPNRTDARVPFFYQQEESGDYNSLVILPRTQRDDFTLPISGRGEAAEGKLRNALISDFDLAVQMGALGFLSIHSQHFSNTSLLNMAMPDLLQHAAQQRNRVWLASSGQIAQWWRERARAEFAINGSSHRFTMTVTVKGEQPLAKGALVINNPQANVPVQVRLVGSEPSNVAVKAVDELRSAVILDGLAPGTHTFEVTTPALQ